MQTFLPYANFAKTAACLDVKRLGKQRVEVLQILSALINKTRGWRNHPCVKMWRGYEAALCEYGFAICHEWKTRGYKDTCYEKIHELQGKVRDPVVTMPPWMGDVDFHQSHQSNLVRKLPSHYSKYFNIRDDLSYIWPINEKIN